MQGIVEWHSHPMTTPLAGAAGEQAFRYLQSVLQNFLEPITGPIRDAVLLLLRLPRFREAWVEQGM